MSQSKKNIRKLNKDKHLENMFENDIDIENENAEIGISAMGNFQKTQVS